MKKLLKTLLSLLIVCAMVFSPAAYLTVGFVSAEQGGAGEVLFSTSFEQDEAEVSGEVIGSSGVIHAAYGIKGKGLEVRLDTVGGSEDYLGSENKYNLFDGKSGTKFLTANNTCEIYFALKTPAAVCSYEIVSANDEATRDPKAWIFYGSNDGKTWSALDTRSNVTFGGRFTSKTFNFTNTTVYEWYKLNVTQNAGAGMIQFASLEVYAAASGSEGPATGGLEVDIDSIESTPANSSSESPENLFDGSAESKYLTAKDNNSCFVTFALTEAAVVKSYTITSANDAVNRDPKAWTLYGSEDGEDWTALDSRSNFTFPDRKTAKTFVISGNTASYIWYKLDVTANGGTDEFGLNMVQIGELSLSASLPAADDEESVPSEIDSSSISATTGYSGHPISYLFDGSVNTKYLVMDSQSATVSFKLNAAEAITRYALSNGDDHLERDPKAWKFYGSANGTSWTLLDEQTNAQFSGAKSTNVYHFENGAAYLWYKLEITAVVGPDTWFSNQGNGDVYVLHASELELYTEENWHEPVQQEEIIDENGPFTVVNSSVQGTVTTGSDEGVVKLFDRDEATKAVFVATSAWVSFRVNRADAVTAYAITSANDWANRDPEDWTLYGSADGENWTAVDARTGVSFASRYEEKIFRLSAPAEYLYYKFDITKNGGNATYTQLSDLTLMTVEEVPEVTPGFSAVKDFGPTQTDTGKAGAWTGRGCLAVYGEQSETTGTYARAVLFDGLNIPVSADTTLSYVIFPGLFNIKNYDYEYTSCRVIVDLHFTDGTYLSELGVRDQNGSTLTPAGQVAGETLFTMQWNYVEAKIGAAGKTIDRIDVFFEMDEAEDASKFLTFFDDLKIENKTDPTYAHLSDYITILRGTNNDSAFSRGLCTPGVALPNGYNFYSPVTNPAKATASYNYQVNGDNNPLDSITVIHAPSYWLSSYGTWQFMANTSVNASGSVTAAAISSEARRAKFSHENEIAHAHYYSVTLDEGTAASGVKIEVTPTSHAAYVRFTFPANADNVNVIFDDLWGTGATFTPVGDNKGFTATTAHNSAGSTKMYVCGTFDQEYELLKIVSGGKAIASFPAGTTTVTMKIATSFLSYAQAQHSMDLEIAEKDFGGVFAEAQATWDDLCGKFEIEGASYTELVNFYSSLYRMYAYPNLYSENEGTNENPRWVYASPYKSGAKTSGILYTNNGFWDTYRTTWAGYSLFTADKDGEMLNGIVQHYIDSGWIPRWICPGGVNCMVGTSSDIIFADAYIKGIDFDYENAWESMVENASALSSNLTKGGRPNNNITPYLGYVPNSIGEGYSSSIESYINDYGLYRMAEEMGLTSEAEYYRNRCLKYAELFNEEAGFFMGKSESGVFSATSATYDPAGWGGPKGDYTESVGWVNTFPAVFDPEGLVSLYGGREALAAKLNEMFDDSPDAMRKVVTGIGHEICEFKEVRMGQYEHNNQPSHHVIYTYAFSSEPYRVQQYTREVLRHVYVGSEIGQGFPGDEDNGEMSAWYVFNALGFYPYCLASGEYMIGSPLFDKVTVHLDNGNDIVIIANNNSQENVYIQSATVNGQAYNDLYLTHETLTNGCTIVYEMGSEPSGFGQEESSRPQSFSTASKRAEYQKDLLDGAAVSGAYAESAMLPDAKTVYAGVSSAAKILDGNSSTNSTISNGSTVVLAGTPASNVSMITLSCDSPSKAPTGLKVEVSNDGRHFKTVLEETGIAFQFTRSVIPFAIPEELRGSYLFVRVTLTGGTKLTEIEMIGETKEYNVSDVTALLDYLSLSAQAQEAYGVNNVFASDVTAEELTVKDVTALLNVIAGDRRLPDD